MFAGKVALVTGGSSGLGEATALKFAREGAKVVIAARRAEQSARVVERIVALGSEALFVPTDVSRAADVEHVVSAAVERFGRLDYAVNNAGIAGPRFTPIAEVTEEQWDEVMGSNLKGVWLCHEVPDSRTARHRGRCNRQHCVDLWAQAERHRPWSLFGQQTWRGRPHPIGRRRLWSKLSIRINAVAPGFTRSEMVDPNRPGAARSIRR